MNRLSGLLGSFGIVLATLLGCGGSDLVLPGNGTPADLRLVNGNEQTGPAGSPLAQPLQVKVVDDRGNPLSGHIVAFALDTDAPGARVDPENASSGRDGIAQSHWTLGAASGTQRVIARMTRAGSAEPLEVRFTASVEVGAARKVARVNGNEQSAEAGRRLADPLVVRVTDEVDNPVEGVVVDWTAEEGSLDPASSVTGSDGQAQTSWTLGPATGSQSATASSSGLDGSPVRFTATGRGGSGESRLAFRVQPSDAGRDQRITPPIEVVVLNQAGGLVTQGRFKVKLELTASDNGNLKGHLDEDTRAGVATFDDLKVDREGEYRLRASTDGLPSVDSDRFEVKED